MAMFSDDGEEMSDPQKWVEWDDAARSRDDAERQLGGAVAADFGGLRSDFTTSVDGSQLILVQHRPETPLYNIVSYRIGVEDVGFRLYNILFLVNTESLYCINYLLLLLRFPVPAISHL